MGKRRTDQKMNVAILTERLGVEETRLDCDTLHIESPDTIEAWELDPYQLSRDEKKGNNLQVVSERNKKPLKVFRDRPAIAGRAIETIAGQKFDEEMTIIQERKQKQSMLLWIGIITAIIAVTIGIIVLVNMKGG